MKRALSFLVVGAASIGLASALNTSSVFSPDVDAGTSAAEYRFSAIPDDDDDAFAHRFHYQQAIDGMWRWRVITLHTDRGAGDLEFRYVRFEMQQQIRENEVHGWDAAFRYELQIAESDDRPSRVRVQFTNKWKLDDRWEARAIGAAGVDMGAEASSGMAFETRSQVTRVIIPGWRVGAEMYNDFGSSDDFGSFDDQDHQLGPIVKMSLSRAWRVEANALYGLSDAAANVEYRLHVIRAL